MRWPTWRRLAFWSLVTTSLGFLTGTALAVLYPPPPLHLASPTANPMMPPCSKTSIKQPCYSTITSNSVDETMLKLPLLSARRPQF